MNRKEKVPDIMLYGVMAAFAEPEQLVEATRRAREAGYRRMDAYTPFEVEGLEETLGAGRSYLPLFVLGGAALGGVGGYFMQYYGLVINYPYNIGGRPLHSWPLLVPIAFETAVLVAALVALGAMLLLNALPQPYHPVFNVEGFDLASRNRFFLCIEARDPRFHRERTSRFLQGLGALWVSEVEC